MEPRKGASAPGRHGFGGPGRVLLIVGLILAGAFALHARLAPASSSVPLVCGTNPAPPGSTALPKGDLLFDANKTGNYEIYTSSADGTGMQQLTDNPLYDSWYARLSPDRTRILFYRVPANAHDHSYSLTSLWMMNANGTDQTELLSQGCYSWKLQGHAEWSPDGTKLAMIGGSNGGQIFTTDVNGASPHQVTTRFGPNIDPSWSPDGKTIVFIGCPVVNCTASDEQVYTTPAAGGAVTQLTNTTANYKNNDPRYSLDGSTIAWEAETQLPGPLTSSGVWQIEAVNSNGTDLRTLTTGQDVSSNPFFAVGGTKICFYRFDYGSPKWQLWRMNLDGSDPVQITHNSSYDSEMVSC